jgi:hypothetical protein
MARREREARGGERARARPARVRGQEAAGAWAASRTRTETIQQRRAAGRVRRRGDATCACASSRCRWSVARPGGDTPARTDPTRSIDVVRNVARDHGAAEWRSVASPRDGPAGSDAGSASPHVPPPSRSSRWTCAGPWSACRWTRIPALGASATRTSVNSARSAVGASLRRVMVTSGSSLEEIRRDRAAWISQVRGRPRKRFLSRSGHLGSSRLAHIARRQRTFQTSMSGPGRSTPSKPRKGR